MIFSSYKIETEVVFNIIFYTNNKLLKKKRC